MESEKKAAPAPKVLPPLSEDIFDEYDPKFRIYHQLEQLVFRIKKETVDKTADFIKSNFTESSDFSYVHDLIVYASSDESWTTGDYSELWSKIPKPDHRMKLKPFIEDLIQKKIETEDIIADKSNDNNEYEYEEEDEEVVMSSEDKKGIEIIDIIRKDDVQELKKRFEAEPEIIYNLRDYQKDSYGMQRCDEDLNALNFSASFASVKVFSFLLEKGFKIDSSVEEAVIQGGSMEIFKMCIDRGLTFSYTITSAVENHRDEMLKWIIAKNGIDNLRLENCVKSCNTFAFLYFYTYADEIDKYDREKSLYYACKMGHFIVAKMLLESQQETERMNLDFIQLRHCTSSPLAVAAGKGHTDIARLLVDYGASLEEGGDNGTPLYNAAINGQFKALQFLLEKGANMNTRFKADCDSIDAFTAACTNNHYDVVDYMLEFPSQFHKCAICTTSCIKNVAFQRNTKMLEHLFSKGVSLGKMKGCGRQKLIRYVWDRYIEMDLMMRCGTRMDPSFAQPKSIQMLLNEEKTKQVIEILLKNGCARHY